jgi:hypothetical protein
VIDEYHRRGFLGVELAWSEAENGAKISTPAAVLTITEGAVYRLRRLEMVGNANTCLKTMRACIVFELYLGYRQVIAETRQNDPLPNRGMSAGLFR